MEKFFETPKSMQKNVIRVKNLDDLPEGAVMMTHDEVLQHHVKIVMGWKKSSEIWPLRYGMGIMGGAAALSGLVINGHYRKTFKLAHYGRVASYLPAVCLPAMLSLVFHQMMITNNILVGDFGCPLCVQTRSGALAAGLGGIYPLLISPISSIILARKYYTMPIPKITEGARIASLFQRTSPIISGFLLLVLQFSLGMIIADQEMKTFTKKIAKSQRDLHADSEEMSNL